MQAGRDNSADTETIGRTPEPRTRMIAVRQAGAGPT